MTARQMTFIEDTKRVTKRASGTGTVDDELRRLAFEKFKALGEEEPIAKSISEAGSCEESHKDLGDDGVIVRYWVLLGHTGASPSNRALAFMLRRKYGIGTGRNEKGDDSNEIQIGQILVGYWKKDGKVLV